VAWEVWRRSGLLYGTSAVTGMLSLEKEGVVAGNDAPDSGPKSAVGVETDNAAAGWTMKSPLKFGVLSCRCSSHETFSGAPAVVGAGAVL